MLFNMPAHAPSPVYGGWVSYEGRDAVVLAIVLIALATSLVYLGMKVQSALKITRPGRTVSAFMIAIWALAIYTFLVAVHADGIQLRQVHLLFRAPNVKVGTLLDAVVTFFV